MENEMIEIVTNQGKVIGKINRLHAYKTGALHKAVNVLIYNQKEEIFLQQRAANKSSFPLYWDISCAEHVKIGETYKQAAHRGLKEELSIDAILKKIRQKHIQKSEFKKNGKKVIENELVELYAGTTTSNIKINNNEVKNGSFMKINSIASELKKNNLKFTPWALDELNYIIKVRPQMLL